MSFIKLFEEFVQKKETDSKSNLSVLVEEDADQEAEAETEDEEHDTDNSGSTTVTAETSTGSEKMEHSFMVDSTPKPNDITNGLPATRTILVRRPPQCASCHTNPSDEQDLNDANQVQIPSYNEIAAKEAMVECSRMAKRVKNINSDTEDWEANVNQIGWSNLQKSLFSKVASILDNDQLGRLSCMGRSNEAIQLRVVIDKSVGRLRKVFASVSWESRLTQWLHGLLMDCLPPSYMGSYLDILQTLKSKLPTVMDKMMFGRPMNVSRELLAPVMKKQWEPEVNTKMRNLPHNAVIVTLPILHTNGTVPTRLKKWYQNLATITQIVQITMPMSAGFSHQPLDQIAEQIVSLTRVKIQELRMDKRSVILIGFNAGAALALQVAMSENVSCVVCMGFAYNTYNGVRGTQDDRILDIKSPVLFVVGENSARTSPEEIEFLREKMQSQSSFVVVGSADDTLRVPKSKRRIESVTQSMVDNMVVDEIYDFAMRVLTNPPGTRTPTVISCPAASKQPKTTTSEKTTVQARKRKQDANDSDGAPAKTKHIIGRPRTRPLPGTASTNSTKLMKMQTSTPVMIGKMQNKSKLNALTNEDLDKAIQSIMGDTTDPDLSLNTSSDSNSKKLMTNFELVTQSSKSPLLKPTNINHPPKQMIIGSSSTPIGTKIKMIPSNKFVQLKPTTLQSQSKIYTIKTTPGGDNNLQQGPRIGSIVTTSPNTTSSGQHIFTLKTPNGQTTQFATAVGGQPKYAMIKNAATGNTTLQLPGTSKTMQPMASTSSGAGIVAASDAGNYDLSSIIDMPILFADNDGNLSDAVSSPQPVMENKSTTIKPVSASSVGQLIISQKIIKEANTPGATGSPNLTTARNYVLNKPRPIIQSQPLGGTKSNKFVFINRNTMKPCTNIISRTNVTPHLPKYSKVVVANTKSPAISSVVSRPIGSQISALGSGTTSIASSIKQYNLQSLSSPSLVSSSTAITPTRTGGILNVQTKNLPQVQILSNPHASLISSDKPQIRNIVVKPGGLKQLPPHLTSQLLNRNLTVRKLVNIVPTTNPANPTGGNISITSTSNPLATATTLADGIISTSDPSTPSTVASNIQTFPKIITLNPLSRTSTPTTKSD